MVMSKLSAHHTTLLSRQQDDCKTRMDTKYSFTTKGPSTKHTQIKGAIIKNNIATCSCSKYFTHGQLILARAVQSKKDDKDKELIRSSTTPDPGYHMRK